MDTDTDDVEPTLDLEPEPDPDAPVPEAAGDTDLAELFIVSSVAHGDALNVTRTEHHKCGRCWRHLPEVAEDGALCSRCDQVTEAMDAGA